MPRVPDLLCAECGKLLWRGGRSLPVGQARCAKCIGRGDGPRHGSQRRYKAGCRCDLCRAENARSFRQHKAKRKSEGNPLPKSSNRGHRYHLNRAQRVAIYERDDWTCQLCGVPVDPDLHHNDLMAATLDHIVPQAFGPDHSPENLRLAHRICNARRGTKEVPWLSVP